jgi:microsomal dipeptidase-like Zn-dependent dipeptidase/lysophospholipase L1-like esterase
VRGGGRVLRVRQTDGTLSNRLSFIVLPHIAAVGSGDRERPGSTVTVTGSGFAEGARVRVNGEDMPDSTFVDAATMTFTLRRPATTPDGADGELGSCEVILVDGTRSASVTFTIDTLHVVVIGDSVAWGQGLREEDKYVALVSHALSARNGGIKSYATVLAHSGAIIGIGDGTMMEPLPGEVPTSYPTAIQQIEMVTGDPDRVDLVLLTCGLNDVNFRTVVHPLTTASTIAASVDRHCRSDLSELLVATVSRFPQAQIVVSGYYPILSEDSDTTEIQAFLVAAGVSIAGLPGGVLGAALIPQITNNCRIFHELSTAAIATAVDEANAVLPTPRILFADTGFGPENAVFASDPWLFAINGDLSPQDAAAGDRGVVCQLNPTRTDVFQCTRASVGHPNATGAQAYADAILAALAAGATDPPGSQDRTGLGFADVHCHQFAHLGFGGRAFWGNPQGELAEALGSCEPVHGAFGLLDVVGNTVRAQYGHSILGHGVKGYPEFDGWPRWDSFTHQAVHEEWLRRAVQGGLRLMVMLAVNNEPMSNLVTRAPGRTSNDMEAVDLQLEAARAMEAHIDAISGGAGKGWYRIVETADQALDVIESGRLAVVLGIEVDYLFNCRTESDLSPDQLRAELDKYYDRGVRHLFPIHFGDNGFGGAAFQNGLERSTGGGPVSPRNPLGTLDFYTIQTEDAGTPGYEYRANRRNVRGLTDLGKTLVKEMIQRGMIIDIDHMSQYSRNDTLDICTAAGYPGLISGHNGFLEISHGNKSHEGNISAVDLHRIRELGGMVCPLLGQGGLEATDTWHGTGSTRIDHINGNTSNSLVQAYLYAAEKMKGRPVGFGSDLNGFAQQPGPRFAPHNGSPNETPPRPTTRLRYPFRAAATGKMMSRSVVGPKAFDFNRDGLAHVGMLPDLIADLEAMGLTQTDLLPLLTSATGYANLWRKASAGHVPSSGGSG